MKITKKLRSVLLGPVPVSRDRAIGISERCAAVTTLTSSLEYLVQHRETDEGGLNDWRILRRAQVGASPITRRLLDVAGSRRVTTALHVARATVSAGLLVHPGNGRWRGAGGLFLGLSSVALYRRHRYGSDGSDQVALLTQLCTGLARTARSPQTQDAVLWHLAVQSNLSYAVAGWLKLLGPAWRDGSALPGILRTRTYGHEPSFRLAHRYPKATRAVAHGVLALECLFPVVYLAGGRLARPVIGSVLAFHLANGYVMGLGRFVSSFVSMHPAVAYTSTPRNHPAVAGRDDRAVVAGALVLAGAMTVAGAVAVHRRLRVLSEDHTSSVTTRHGNLLRYDSTGTDSGEDRPVLVLVAGLASTAEHFAWVVEQVVADTGCEAVTYARAGYAASRRRATTPFRLDEAVDDLVDLVRDAVPPHRDVVLVGHSLGGELARRAAAQLGDQLGGIVYLDPSHPDELNRSEQQKTTARAFATTLSTMIWSLRSGLGTLLVRPPWLHALPRWCQQSAFDQYVDSRLWVAGRREWRAVEADFRDFTGGLPALRVPALVVSAQRTVDREPEQLLMHHELAEAHRGEGRHVHTTVLEEADHDSMLTHGRLASATGRHISDFLDRTAGAADQVEPDAETEARR
ncbi:alpha/beta fold hydrolase [Streptomyces sp. NPDC048057]|uniref:alpha/beta fold hydrolase n=1 Tax=Streptomyces sp. NPDC048057 TaxID=3155628 RepID=UPI0033E56950